MSELVQSWPSVEVKERLAAIAAALTAGKDSPTVTVREFLSWFGVMRRGQWLVRALRIALRGAGLVTEPDFEGAYIDAPIVFVLASQITTAVAAQVPESSPTAVERVTAVEETSPVTVGIADPTYRLSRLAAANNAPVSVAPDRPLADAITLMLSNDFSQLPVMTSERTVKGMISWRSIGARLVLGKGGPEVRSFMEDWSEIAADKSLFLALPTIVEQGYVLVRDGTARISGIVTTADLSRQFQQLAEPFLLLGEIENHIRRLIDGKFTKEELVRAKDPSDTSRQVENVADLTFGEYLRLFQEPAFWAKVGLAIDRAMFTKSLEAVRLIRNDVMHFDPDPLDVDDLAVLRKFARFLQSLQSLGV